MPLAILLDTLIKHYRRHPVQAVFLLVGITVANMLLSGTLLINAQARASYSQGEQYLSAVPTGQLRHRNASRGIEEVDYIRLRRQGFDMLAPLQRHFLRTAEGQSLELLGLDIFAMPRLERNGDGYEGDTAANLDFTAFAFPPWQLWVGKARLEQLGLAQGDRITLSSGKQLPPLHVIDDRQMGHRMLIDMGALQTLTGQAGELNSILVFPASTERLQSLITSLPEHLEFIDTENTPDPAELTQSFHLNLAAMGLLAFVVGVFLVYNALAFSYTDRRELIRKLRLAGVTRRELAGSLLLELLLFLLVGSLAGSLLGAQLASWLLPGVGQTLAQLYGVYIAYPDGLVPSGIWLPLLMTALAAGLCVLFPLRESLDRPLLSRSKAGWQRLAELRRDRLMAWSGLGLLFISALAGFYAASLWLALAGMACLLLGAAFLLPAVLRFLLNTLQKRVPSRQARLSWMLADSRWLLGPVSLALMAMTLALVANSGLNTMISSFRQATDQWMDQRLAADIYLRGDIEIAAIRDFLRTTAPGLEVAERYRRRAAFSNAGGDSTMIEVVSLQEGKRFHGGLELIRATAGARDRFLAGEGIFISERAWRKDGWQPGATVELCPLKTAVPIVGVYHDYGNPLSQWMLGRQLFLDCWPDQSAQGFAILGPKGTDWNDIRSIIRKRFSLNDDEIINQADLKQAGLAVFDRTFAVTNALNALTLLVAGIGIFCAISAIHHHRAGQQALLASLGMNRRERGALLLLQWSVLGLLCMVLVWPFGTLLAAYLAAVVTPIAFGWSFPLHTEWSHYLVLTALAIGSMTLAVILPSLRLLGISAAALLREETL